MLYFIVNGASRTGQGKENWRMMCELMQEKGIKYKAYLTKHEGHATQLAKQISELPDKDICIVVVGGDGTVNEALNGISDFDKVRFAVIPNGSGNDFVRGMGTSTVPIDAITKITKIAEEGPDSYRPTDLGRVCWKDKNDSNEELLEKSRIFGISSGIGLDAIVARDVDGSKLKKILNFFHMGNLTYTLLTVIDLFKMETAELDMTLTMEDDSIEERHFKKLIFMAAMNQFAEGGGVPMAPKASNCDGMLSFAGAHGVAKWRTFLLLPLLVMAKHENLKAFDIRNAKKATYKLSREFTLHTDGEYLGEVSEVAYECLPGILRYLD